MEEKDTRLHPSLKEHGQTAPQHTWTYGAKAKEKPAENAQMTSRQWHQMLPSWSGKSPALNLTQYVWGPTLWGIMKAALSKENPKRIWRSLTPAHLLNLYSWMPRRMAAVIAAEGEATQ